MSVFNNDLINNMVIQENYENHENHENNQKQILQHKNIYYSSSSNSIVSL